MNDNNCRTLNDSFICKYFLCIYCFNLTLLTNLTSGYMVIKFLMKIKKTMQLMGYNNLSECYRNQKNHSASLEHDTNFHSSRII